MSEDQKNLEINSEILSEIKEKKINFPQIQDLAKDILKVNPLLNYCDVFEKSSFFKKKILKKGELLFNEGALDTNIYIIKKGLLSVEKYTTLKKNETIQLAILKTGDFLGEASLDSKNREKEAKVKTLEESEILLIDGKKNLSKFIQENPFVGYEFLKYIIIETNRRLLEANKLLASNYKVERAISSLKKIDSKSIFSLIDQIRGVVLVDYVLYFEKHQIMNNFLILRYDSRFPNKMQDLVFEKSGNFLDLEELFNVCNIPLNDRIIINKLAIGKEIFGYLIFGRTKKGFNSSDKKIFSSLSNSLVGVIKKFFQDRELRNKDYIRDMKK